MSFEWAFGELDCLSPYFQEAISQNPFSEKGFEGRVQSGALGMSFVP